MVSILVMRTLPSGQPVGLRVEYQDGSEPAIGEKLRIDGLDWHRMSEEGPVAPAVHMEPATIAHSMPRRGDRRDPGAPRYDKKNRPVLLTSEEKATYAKKYEQHNRESCRFERTSSQGAFGDEE